MPGTHNRAHMRGPDGVYLAPPPPWAPVGRGPANLARFIDVSAPFLGEVMDKEALLARFAPAP